MSENKILYSDVNLSQDVKRAGKGSVDVANGRLSFVHEDVSIPFGKSSFTLSHVYDGSSGKWRYNVEEYIAVGEDYNVLELDSTKVPTLIYTNASGRKYTFIKHIENGKSFYINVDLKIKINKRTNELNEIDECIIYRDEGGMSVYSRIGNAYKLTQIIGQEAVWSNAEAKYVGAQINIEYEKGVPKKIINDNGDCINIADSLITSSLGDRIKLQFSSNKLTQFIYQNSDGTCDNGTTRCNYNNVMLTSVCDRSGYAIKYDYEGNKIVKISELYPEKMGFETSSELLPITFTSLLREEKDGLLCVRAETSTKAKTDYAFKKPDVSPLHEKYTLVKCCNPEEKNQYLKNEEIESNDKGVVESWGLTVGGKKKTIVHDAETGTKLTGAYLSSAEISEGAILSQPVRLGKGTYAVVATATLSVSKLKKQENEESLPTVLKLSVNENDAVLSETDFETYIPDMQSVCAELYIPGEKEVNVVLKASIADAYKSNDTDVSVHIDKVELYKSSAQTSRQSGTLSVDGKIFSFDEVECLYDGGRVAQTIPTPKNVNTNSSAIAYFDEECFLWAKALGSPTVLPIKYLDGKLHKGSVGYNPPQIKIADKYYDISSVVYIPDGYQSITSNGWTNETSSGYIGNVKTIKKKTFKGSAIFESLAQINKVEDADKANKNLRLDTTKNYRNIVERAEYVSNADADETTRNAAYASENRETYYGNKNDSSKKITSSKVYDNRYRLTEETDERGNKTTYTYNADNTPASVRLPNGEVINYKYDEFFRVSKITKGGKSIEYEYLYDMPVKVCTDGKEYEIAYDGNCEIKSIKERAGGEQKVLVKYERKRSAKYETANDVNYVTERKEDEILKTEYDKRNRVKTVKKIENGEEKTVLEYRYNGDDLIGITDSSAGENNVIETNVREYGKERMIDKEYSSGYDVTERTEGDVRKEAYSFEITGGGNSNTLREEYKYDSLGIAPYPDNTVAKTNYLSDGTSVMFVNYTRDNLTRMVKEDVFAKKYDADNDFPCVFCEENVYEDVGENNTTGKIKERKITVGDTIKSLAYSYDEKGNIIGITEPGEDGENDKKVRFTYDENGRLIREDNNSLDKTTIYEYNENGDIESKKYYHYSENDELEAIRKKKTVGGTFCGKYYCGESVVCDRLSIYVPMETYFKYDPYGRLTGVGDKQISYDDNGRPLNYLGTEIEWDGSRMKKYGSSEYEYDGDNCRLSKTVKGKKRLFFYDVQNALRVERTEEGEIHYLYDASGVRGFEYVEYSVPGAALSRAKYYYEKDLQGNIVGIVNSEGTEIVKYEYVDAWGSFNEYYLTDEGRVVAALNSFTYRGYYYDKESGLYYLINRYYDPTTGRFISPDDVGYLDFESFFGTNRYAYCLDDPVNYIDPEGKFAITSFVISLVVGIVIGFGTKVLEDYLDDGQIFNGSVTLESYLASASIGAITGAIGGIGANWLVQSAVSSMLSVVQGYVDGTLDLNDREKVLRTMCLNFFTSAISAKLSDSIGDLLGKFRYNGLLKISKNNRIINKSLKKMSGVFAGMKIGRNSKQEFINAFKSTAAISIFSSLTGGYCDLSFSVLLRGN